MRQDRRDPSFRLESRAVDMFLSGQAFDETLELWTLSNLVDAHHGADFKPQAGGKQVVSRLGACRELP
jgi:hypothetical protein